jgi:hypothetical protein
MQYVRQGLLSKSTRILTDFSVISLPIYTTTHYKPGTSDIIVVVVHKHIQYTVISNMVEPPPSPRPNQWLSDKITSTGHSWISDRNTSWYADTNSIVKSGTCVPSTRYPIHIATIVATLIRPPSSMEQSCQPSHLL